MDKFNLNRELGPIAKLIINEDIDGLKQELNHSWNLDNKIEIYKNFGEYPIIYALDNNKIKVIDFLIQNGANLNLNETPSITMAASRCSIDTIKLLLNNGAKLNAINHVGSNALKCALYFNRYELIPELIKMGIDVKKDGTILRSAVFSKQMPGIKILLDHNIDVNYHTPDMVFPYNPTAVCIAANNNDFDIVKLLVEHGADVTIKDDYGDRPYLAAKKNRNDEMAEYIKALEPKEWHNEEQKLISLKPYKLPEKLINFLRGNELKVLIENNTYISFVVFNSLLNCKEVHWNGYKFIDLLSDADKYPAEGFLVWYPKKKCLACADYEHEEFRILDKWDSFINNPSNTIDKIFE